MALNNNMKNVRKNVRIIKSFIIIHFYKRILQRKMETKIDANKVLEDLIKASLDCAQYIGKNEDLSEMAVNNGLKEELEKANEKVNTNGNKVYVFQDQSEHEIPNELVLKYPESLFYYNLIDLDSRMEKRIEADIKLKYFDEILKYMKNEFDIKNLISIQFEEFCRELMMLHIPFRDDIIEHFFSLFNEYGVSWKNRYMEVNGKQFNSLFGFMKLKDLRYNSERNRYEIIKNISIPAAAYVLTDFAKYLKDPSQYMKDEKLKIKYLLNAFSIIGIDTSTELVKDYLLNYTKSLFCYGTEILENTDYDSVLREWCGDYQWKLIYRASNNSFSYDDFHEYCDDKGPTLIIMRTLEGWILGGYTTQSWNLNCMYYDII